MTERLVPLGVRNGRVKAARKLSRRSARAEEGVFLAEGAKALREALQLPGNVVEVFATAVATGQEVELEQVATAAGVPWRLCSDDAIGALSGAVTPQGIVAVCRTFEVPLDDLIADPDADLLVICADVRDPGNAGTVIRCADAVAASGVMLTGNSVDPFNDKTVRATVGSLWHLPIGVGGDPAEVVRAVQLAGYVVLAADGAGETDLFEATDSGLLSGKVAWLFGNEAWGLPGALAELADHRISIPITGRAESLNLSTAAAVCLYASAGVRRG